MLGMIYICFMEILFYGNKTILQETKYDKIISVISSVWYVALWRTKTTILFEITILFEFSLSQ